MKIFQELAWNELDEFATFCRKMEATLDFALM
jgi:hypothetical protein